MKLSFGFNMGNTQEMENNKVLFKEKHFLLTCYGKKKMAQLIFLAMLWKAAS